MTTLQHMAWYNAVIANFYAASGKFTLFALFAMAACVLFAISYLESRR